MSDDHAKASLKIDDLDEVLLRQVHPVHLDEDAVVQSVAFNPSREHQGLLSTLRERVGAEEAYRRHKDAGLASAGTWGVSVREADENSLPCLDDEHLPDSPPDHASIDFSALSRKGAVRAAKLLRDAAVARGCLHPAEDAS
ncbi:hypothetical protein [Intrasporangium flavum]|uniref:hypothetical protein n=1 Tax=Intrasporangium flavum TaxID=1428657 RepID=UPI001A956678|nr:hypothetical protein [Intrasporangium flavum]